MGRRRGINSLKWITALCQEHCRNTSDYWEDGISAFLYRLADCQRMLFPVVGGRWLGRIGSVIEIMHFYRSASGGFFLARVVVLLNLVPAGVVAGRDE